MFRYILLIALVPAVVLATKGVENCGKNIPFPNTVDIKDCDETPCPLVRGSTGITIVNMTIPHDIESFEPTVKAKVGFITINYDLPDDVRKGCNFLHPEGSTSKCPLKKGDVVIYEMRQEVDKNSPTIFNPELTFKIIDENKKTIVCYKWVGKII